MRIPRRFGTCLAASLLLVSSTLPVRASVRYVNQNASGANNGTSWANAYTDLQSALAVAVAGDQVWVAEGIYFPTATTNRNIHFTVIGGVALYGGFAGTETLLSQRDWSLHQTILSGDIGVAGNASDNTQIIVFTTGLLPAAIVDGFTVQDGRNDYPVPSSAYGGGIYAANRTRLRNLIVRDNYAGYGGGGIYANADTVWVENSLFVGNAAGIRGGGIWSGFSTRNLATNVVFLNNTAPVGGGWYADRFNQGTNLTFVGNSSSSFTGAFGGSLGNAVYNTIAWNNGLSRDASFTVYNSDLQGCGGSAAWDTNFGTDGGGNVDIDPMFVDLFGGDCHLSFASPGRDIGSNAAPQLLSIDLDGLPRIAGGTVDMGAYEFHCPPDTIVRVDARASGRLADGSSWNTAYTSLRRALASSCGSVSEIWIAEGTYRPTNDSSPSARNETFKLRNGLRIYGGFGGTEAAVSQRDLSAHETILSGEIAGETANDNILHVVTASGTDHTAILDGCTITRGFAPEDAAQPMGAGMLNAGGSPTLSNIVFRDNFAGGSGGALANYIGASPTLVNVVFVDNGSVASGGAIYNVLSNPVITNVTFEGNFSAGGAGVMFNNVSSPHVTNAIVWGNTGGSVVQNQSSTPVFDHCLIQGSGGSAGWQASYGADAGGNLDTDPQFVDAAGGNLHIALTSPAVDAGNLLAPQLPATDIEGHDRIIGGGVDMGAYESDAVVGVGGKPSLPPRFDADPNPFNPSVTFDYVVTQRSETNVAVYDVQGRLVRTLVTRTEGPGAHRAHWDGRDNHGARVSSGVYLVRFVSGATTLTRKITLLK